LRRDKNIVEHGKQGSGRNETIEMQSVGASTFAGGEDYGYFDNPREAGSIPVTASGRVPQWQSIGMYRRRLIPRRALTLKHFNRKKGYEDNKSISGAAWEAAFVAATRFASRGASFSA
jgi:hypothetical protein